MTSRLHFLGAAGTVTGSRYRVETDGANLLVDCGIFQGGETRTDRTGRPLRIDTATLDGVLITHAHLDHCGHLPALVAQGFSGPVYLTPQTADIAALALADSAHLQERAAERSSEPPLFTRRDAAKAVELFRTVGFGKSVPLPGAVTARFGRAGHILGAASVLLSLPDQTLLFSGDLGRHGDVLMPAPERRPFADTVVMESTYGDRVHPETDVERELVEHIGSTVADGGTVIMPAFTIGRTQAMLVLLDRVIRSGRLSDIPIFLDSPMAIRGCDIHQCHAEELRVSCQEFRRAMRRPTRTQDAEESKALDRTPFPKIIICGSGMAVGGRVVHHLKSYLEDPRALVLFTGFQAPGTPGEALVGGADRVRLHGRQFEVRANVAQVTGLSAHADADELIEWLDGAPSPRRVYLTHGMPSAAATLAQSISGRLGYPVSVPSIGDSAILRPVSDTVACPA